MGPCIIYVQPILSHEEYELQEARDLLKVTVAEIDLTQAS